MHGTSICAGARHAVPLLLSPRCPDHCALLPCSRARGSKQPRRTILFACATSATGFLLPRCPGHVGGRALFRRKTPSCAASSFCWPTRLLPSSPVGLFCSLTRCKRAAVRQASCVNQTFIHRTSRSNYRWHDFFRVCHETATTVTDTDFGFRQESALLREDSRRFWPG